jgi:hypothetical protein
MSLVRSSVNKNSGFGIGWLDFLALLLQLHLITSFITAHNRWLSETRSISSWTTTVFSSVVTYLVLIYESVTSSVSTVRWLTLHNWTLNFLTNESSRLTTPLQINFSFTNELPFTSAFEPKSNTVLNSSTVVFCIFVATGICLPNRCLAMEYFGFQAFWHTRCLGNMLRKVLSSNGLFQVVVYTFANSGATNAFGGLLPSNGRLLLFRLSAVMLQYIGFVLFLQLHLPL